MMIRVISFLACILFAGTVYSQSNAFGIHLLANYSTFEELDIPNINSDDFYDYNVGYGLGVSYVYSLGRLFYLRGELNYERKGANLNIDLTDENGNDINEDQPDLHLGYLSLPILLQANFGEKAIITPQLGMSIHYLFNVENTQEDYFFGYPNLDQFNRLDHSLIVGAGIQFPLINDYKLYLNGRFAYGLNELDKEGLLVPWATKNRVFSLLAGIQL